MALGSQALGTLCAQLQGASGSAAPHPSRPRGPTASVRWSARALCASPFSVASWSIPGAPGGAALQALSVGQLESIILLQADPIPPDLKIPRGPRDGRFFQPSHWLALILSTLPSFHWGLGETRAHVDTTYGLEGTFLPASHTPECILHQGLHSEP